MTGFRKQYALLAAGLVTTTVTPCAKADLRNPYLVEVNSPQYFGDSSPVDGHYGLENYLVSYVAGYLRISFTTTHNIWCYAGYPPQSRSRGGAILYSKGRPTHVTQKA